MRALTFLALVTPTLLPSAQEDERRPLEHEDTETWNRLSEVGLSKDGAWFVHRLLPAEGDSTLYVRESDGERAWEIANGAGARWDSSGTRIVCRVGASGEGEDATPDSVVILHVADGSSERIEGATRFDLGEELGVLVYELPPSAEERKEGALSTVVVRQLESGEEQRHEHLRAWTLSEDGGRLAFVRGEREDAPGALGWVETQAGATAMDLVPTPTEVRGLTFDAAGEQLAALVRSGEGAQARWTLWAAEAGEPGAVRIAWDGSPGLPEGWGPSERRSPSFSESGARLLFGTAPLPEPEQPELPEDERVALDVWAWTDSMLQPEQLVRAASERRRTYLAVAHLRAGAPRVVQLADRELNDVSLGDGDDSPWALGISVAAYRHLSSWESDVPIDLWLIDVTSGERRLLQERWRGRTTLSPTGRYAVSWNGETLQWQAVALPEGRPIVLSAGIEHPLYDETNDRPMLPRGYGIAGWLPGDEGVIVRDRYDLWLCDPRGVHPPRCWTEGRGRAAGVRLNLVDLDAESESVDPFAPQLLSAFEEESKRSGFWRDSVVGADEPEILRMEPSRFGTPVKAAEADVLRFTRESFDEYPDVWLSDLNFSYPKRMTEANPQQADYLWGDVQLVHWDNAAGEELSGLLYTPEGFDPDAEEAWPTVVYFYERNSDRLHAHHTPTAGGSSIKFPFYTSRGYLVFVPDITYTIGAPGQSAVEDVLSGVRALIDRGWAKEDAIGVQGHSWGGYQIAYMVTQSHLFTAAVSGAPVSNMTSAYGGIRYASGRSRMFQYEHTQSRIGGSLWEETQRYLDNSPLFFADAVETPLLILHNDQDGAVPWTQGIELFVALRRLGKPSWLLNYNGEQHGLTRRPNRRDWARRMQQFLDHYLIGAPAPRWMVEGVPAVDKGRELGLELVEPAD